MRTGLLVLVAGMLGSGGMALNAATPATPEVSLTRLDCGTVQVNDKSVFSDAHAYPRGEKGSLAIGCYLVRHGNDYLLWDAGLPAAFKGAVPSKEGPLSGTLSQTLTEQLSRLGLKPEQIKYVGISHYHFDHTGQAASFPGATLLIGKGDWDALRADPPVPMADPAPLAHWVKGDGKAEPVTGDKDVFGDGTVTLLNTPGHTPGHHSLLVRLKGRGPVLLTGDLAHFHQNYDDNAVPVFNTNRADTLASLDRFKKLAANLKATVIIQHEPADTAKLPAFPAPAR